MSRIVDWEPEEPAPKVVLYTASFRKGLPMLQRDPRAASSAEGTRICAPLPIGAHMLPPGLMNCDPPRLPTEDKRGVAGTPPDIEDGEGEGCCPPESAGRIMQGPQLLCEEP